MRLGFAKAHHKIIPIRKVVEAVGYRSFPIFGVSFNSSVMAEASDFKFDTELAFSNSNYKITPKDKSGRGPRLGSSQNLGFYPFKIYAKAATSDFKFDIQLGFAN